MKLFIRILLLFLLPASSIAQQYPYWEEWNKEQADSLQLIWNNTTNDTLRMGIARSLSNYYSEINIDSALYYAQQQVALARQLKLKLWEADALDGIGYVLSRLKDYPRSLQAFLAGLEIAENKETAKNIWQVSRFSTMGNPAFARLVVLTFCHLDVARLYGFTGNVQKQLYHCFEALKTAEIVDDPSILSNIYSNLGRTYSQLEKLDSALNFLQKSIHYYDVSGFKKYKGGTLSYIGMVYLKKGDYVLAKQYFAKAVEESRQVNNVTDLSSTYLDMGDLFSLTGDKDSSLWYANRGLENAQSAGSPDLLVSAYTSLSAIYKLRNNVDSAFFYQSLVLAAKDSINSVEKIKQFENIGFDEQLKVEELEKEKIQVQTRIRTYVLLAGIGVFVIVAFILYRNNKQKQKSNQLLRQQKEKVESTLSELKSTQSQLIQSEKMASLGELTAGIAHEIQNPLNFVNNFSEVNTELIDELTAEVDKGDMDEVKAIAKDIKENEQKINHHGKRADSIVKGMLQHSRSSSGVKEPTDINALADEYLRLSYHGLRAKDKIFNAAMETDFDNNIDKINVVPQDIGRVILNLITNAFYAVTEKKKLNFENYDPIVSVSTKKINNAIELTVKDNGNGIPQKELDKIFQPFFTTKPTGQGTGLGLSLSYDIIKAYGGEIKVETKEGEGSEFIIKLPAV
jgi:two-component system NtrC family sensor kinase